MYSEKYLKLKDKFDKAEVVFNKNPNSKTATKLSNLRSELNELSDNEKYTLEYANQMRTDKLNEFNRKLNEKKYENSFDSLKR